jgi:major vault protein
LLIRAKEKFSADELVKDNDGTFTVVHRDYEPGNKWMIYGPCNYIPKVEVEVIEKRETIPLDKNEGIYIRDTRTGGVDIHMGSAYMLKSHEELWEMELPETVENLLKPSYFHTNYVRIKHKVVSFRAPFNSAV